MGKKLCLIVDHQQLLYQRCASKRTYEQEKEYTTTTKMWEKVGGKTLGVQDNPKGIGTQVHMNQIGCIYNVHKCNK